MAGSIPWVIISIGVLIIILAVIAIIIKRKYPHPPDYYSFFIIGLTWIPLGLVFKNPGFWAMGLIFMAVGLAHKKDWKKNHRNIKDLSKEERKIVYISVGVGILVLVGFVLYLFLRGGI